MKKIFWTSVVWVALFGMFLLYMKWFNQPLAEWISNFLVKWEEGSIVEAIEDTKEQNVVEEENIVEDKDTEITEEETFVTKADDDVLSQRNKLFEQLDRIEILLGWDTNNSMKESEEVLFDEFKLWYEENKK
jgi:hypothetical protein